MTVIGAGPLGRRLAALACAAGYVTTLEDVLPSNLRGARAELEGVPPETLRFASSVAEAVRDADLVLDSVPDELESKLEILSMVDRMAPPRTVMMTPTSVHSVADLAACTYRGERCLSFEMQERGEEAAVRLVSTKETLPEVLGEVVAFWTRAGWAIEQRVDPGVVPSPTLR